MGNAFALSKRSGISTDFVASIWVHAGPPYRSADKVKHEGWHEQNILVVSLDDQRLTWPERELIHQLGTKLYGRRKPKEVANARETAAV